MPRRPLLVLAVAAVFVVLSYATVATVLMSDHEPPLPGSPQTIQPVWAVPATSPPASILPAPSGNPVAGGDPQPISTRLVQAGTGGQPSAKPHRSTVAVRTSATPAASSASPDLPVVGSTVGLGLRDLPGYRLRHRSFVAHAEIITAASSSLDRLESRYVVRPGRADTRCVSFESVNYPGYFLRHRDFMLRLNQVAGTVLFDADATFCPVVVDDGFALRSVNYPDYHLVLDSGWVRLQRITAKQATAFHILRPL